MVLRSVSFECSGIVGIETIRNGIISGCLRAFGPALGTTFGITAGIAVVVEVDIGTGIVPAMNQTGTTLGLELWLEYNCGSLWERTQLIRNRLNRMTWVWLGNNLNHFCSVRTKLRTNIQPTSKLTDSMRSSKHKWKN